MPLNTSTLHFLDVEYIFDVEQFFRRERLSASKNFVRRRNNCFAVENFFRRRKMDFDVEQIVVDSETFFSTWKANVSTSKKNRGRKKKHSSTSKKQLPTSKKICVRRRKKFFPDHFSVWVFFSSSLSREVLGVGNELFRDPWGRPNKNLGYYCWPLPFKGN